MHRTRHSAKNTRFGELEKTAETQSTDYGQHSTDKQQHPLPFIAGTLLERQELGSPVIKGIATVTVGRNFTLEEWELYFPGEPYRKTFPIYRVREMRTARGELSQEISQRVCRSVLNLDSEVEP